MFKLLHFSPEIFLLSKFITLRIPTHHHPRPHISDPANSSPHAPSGDEVTQARRLPDARRTSARLQN